LPLGIETSTGKKQKVSGMNASSVIDQDILLKDITLLEFLSSQHIPSPICAIFIDMETQYDMIIGMDIMQDIGLNLLNLSKTTIWNRHHLPFKTKDYFYGA
jgi:hypothetical protein